MDPFDFPADVAEGGAYKQAVNRLRENGVLLPTFAQLADPARIPDSALKRLASVDPDAPDSANLFRVHWLNEIGRASCRERV